MPPINGKLPHPFRSHLRRTRIPCASKKPIWAAAFFILLLIAASALLFPTYFPLTHKDPSQKTAPKVEDTFRSSEFWPDVVDPRQKMALGHGSEEMVGVGLMGGIPGDEGKRQRVRHKVLGVVGIQTGFGSAARRKALRKTWMPNTPEGIYSLAYFKAVYQLFDAEFYVKADDDIYLRPDRLTTLLAKDRPSRRIYLGCMKKGPVFSDPNLKWYEPLGNILGQEYFLHAYGPIYALSSEVVAEFENIRNDSHRMFSNEDVTVGAWMLAMNVEHENNHALCEPTCSSTSIAVWDIPKCSGLCNAPDKLLELHKDPTCSKSSTR